ncbi:PD40 domain-containing protein [Nocardioides terrigena]|uniref:PD40 domain-containing protein n=1 Tax=Nocardioides terrigena TaxID=424797 RepID=UPI000D317AFC|nr:PD40 domain-containing protein [Nocardioides terrigena]
MSRLHDALEELSHDAPRPTPHPDLWHRGRRLRRRDRVVSAGLVLVMVLLVGGLATLVTGPPALVGPAGEVVPEGAVPRQIEDVPDHVTEPTDADLAVGPVSVAFVSGNDLPVVVGATDGRYRVLDLPGWQDDSVLAVSPSGERLAWLSATGRQTLDPALSVLTTATGQVQTTRLVLGAGLRPSAASWSPDGTRIAWLGDLAGSRGSGGGAVFGVVEVADTLTETPATPSQRGLVGVAVAEDGSLALGTQSGGLLLDADTRDPRLLPRTDGFPGHFSPSGDVLALETRVPAQESSTVQVATGKQWRHAFPADTFDASTSTPVGWLDDRLQLLLVTSEEDLASELVVTTPEVDGTSTWRRGIGTVDPVAASSLTVAVDLLPDPDGSSTQALTHDFGEPDWPMSDETRLGLLVGGGVLLAALLLTAYVLRRRTRRLI